MALNLVSRNGITMTYLNPFSFDPEATEIVVDGGIVVGNGTDEHRVTVTLKDTGGNPMKGLDNVTLTPTDLETTLVVTPLGETSDGVYEFTIVSDGVGTHELEVAVGDVVIEEKVTVTFVDEDHIDLDLCEISVDQDSIKADGEETATFTIKLFLNKRTEEEELRPATGITDLVLVVKEGDIIAKQEFVGEGEAGVYTIKVTSTEIGQETLYFSTSGELVQE